MEHTTTALLSLGSNLGDRVANLAEAVRRLRAPGRVSAVSSLYETEPMEVSEQPWFLNCAVALDTSLGAASLLEAVLAIEQAMGRQRVTAKGPRSIDIDILLYGDAILDTPSLTLPHPAMAERRFVLAPLAEIAGYAVHPVLHRSVRELLRALPENAGTARVHKANDWPATA